MTTYIYISYVYQFFIKQVANEEGTEFGWHGTMALTTQPFLTVNVKGHVFSDQ